MGTEFELLLEFWYQRALRDNLAKAIEEHPERWMDFYGTTRLIAALEKETLPDGWEEQVRVND